MTCHDVIQRGRTAKQPKYPLFHVELEEFQYNAQDEPARLC